MGLFDISFNILDQLLQIRSPALKGACSGINKVLYFACISIVYGGSRGGRSRRAPPCSGSQKQKKTIIFRPNYASECVLWGLGFQNFSGKHALDPSRAYKRLALPAVVTITSWKKSAPPVCQFLDPPLTTRSIS